MLRTQNWVALTVHIAAMLQNAFPVWHVPAGNVRFGIDYRATIRGP